jgi:hypothetical protein
VEQETSRPRNQADAAPPAAGSQPEYLCDRCGSEMIELNCKVVCPNCGNRFDCSDLNLYFD